MTQKNKILVEQDNEQVIAKFEPRYKGLVIEAQSLKIVDDKSNVRATELIRELEGLSEQYKKSREELYKPIKDHVKKQEARFKVYEKSLTELAGENSCSGLRGQKADYEFKQSEARRIEEEKLQKEQQEKYAKEVKKAEKKGDVPPPSPAPIKVEASKEEGVSYRTEKDYKILIESETPREYLMIDEKKIKAGVKAGIITSSKWINVFERKVIAVKEEKIENL